jgi:SAM-dependent methyltransferase
MISTKLELQTDLDRYRQTARTAGVRFSDQYAGEYESYRTQLDEAVEGALEKLRREIVEASGQSPVCKKLAAQLTEYVDWLQWNLRDLSYIAVAVRPPAKDYQNTVSSLGLVYFSFQIFEDLIHHRYWYQPEQPSMLYAASEVVSSDRSAEALILLAGLLICSEGFSNLSASSSCDLKQLMSGVTDALRRTLVGGMMEQSLPEEWSFPFYDRLVQLKHLEIWRAFFQMLDPMGHSPLFPFLEQAYALGQQLKDVGDLAFDQYLKPGLVSLFSSSQGNNDHQAIHPGSSNGHGPSLAAGEFEASIASALLTLETMAAEMPDPERLIAQIKLGELLEEAVETGLFNEPPKMATPQDEPGEPGLRLQWYSQIQEIIERVGMQALINVNCAVCGSAQRNYLFEAQGFAYHRCLECTHIYVSPRIRADLQVSIGEETDHRDSEGSYLEVQKMYAANICQLLRAQAPGSRLLDIGFGRGYLMELAKAYGFEAFGVDSSRAEIDLLEPQFGKRLERVVIGRDEIPWDSFDVVIMSHTLEHLPDPEESLVKIRGIMNPGAILYIAVPDMQSLQFKVFGKKWDVINPLVHFQYFNEVSLCRLLKKCGFVDLERIRHPELMNRFASRWVRLMRKLGGNDSGELAILAHVPEGEQVVSVVENDTKRLSPLV